MLKKSTILIAALLMATLSGCGSTFRFFKGQSYLNTDLIEASHDATDKLEDKFTRKLEKDTLIVVSTLLNVKNLKETSAFGRIISNQIATTLHESGYQIIGMDLPADVFMMKENGGLQLPDEDQAILKKYKTVYLVGGVYAAGKQNAYVSLRAVDRFTKQVIASTDFSVVLGPDVRVMLKTKDTSIISSAGDLPVSSVEEAVPADKDSVSAVESISNMGSVPGNTAPIPESPSSKSNPMPTVDPAVDGDPFSHQEKPVDSIN
jgi:hypothetical protein